MTTDFAVYIRHPWEGIRQMYQYCFFLLYMPQTTQITAKKQFPMSMCLFVKNSSSSSSFFFFFSWLSVIGQTDKKSHPLVKTIIGYKEQRGEKTYTYNSVIPFLVCLVCFMRLSERVLFFFLLAIAIYKCARLGRNSHLVGHFHLFFLDIKSYGQFFCFL